MGVFKKKNPSRKPRLQPGKQDYSFRRSRTLTGTTSDKVEPSAARLSLLKTPRLKIHELRLARKKTVRLLMIVMIIITGLAFMLVNFIGQVNIIYPQKTTARPLTSAYQQTIKDYFFEHPLQRFGLSLNDTQLEAYLLNKHSEIKSFKADHLWYGGETQFAISFRYPILSWQAADKKLLVDDQGVSFVYDHFAAKPVAVVDKSGITPVAGTSVASQRFIRFLGKTVGAINSTGKLTVTEVIIPNSSREIDLRLTGRGYLIKTHIDRDPLQQAEDILNSVKYFDDKAINPEYIDVRVAGKAFYKN